MLKTFWLLLFTSMFFVAQANDDAHEMIDNYIVQVKNVIQVIDSEKGVSEIQTEAEKLLKVALPILDYGIVYFPECATLASATKTGLSENVAELSYQQIDELYHQEPEDDAKDRCYYNRDLPIHAAFVLALIKEQGNAARADMKAEMEEIIPNAEKLKTFVEDDHHDHKK